MVAATRRRLVEPEQVREAVAGVRRRPEPVVTAEHVGEQGGEVVSKGVVERGQRPDVPPRREPQSVRVARRERYPRHPVAVFGDRCVPWRAAPPSSSRQIAQPPRRAHLVGRRGRHERVAVDLAVRMVDRRPHLAAAVLEHEHVLDLRPREQRLGARRPRGRRPCAPDRGAGSRATASCSGEKSTTSHAPTAGTDDASPAPAGAGRRSRRTPGASAGQRLVNQRTSYGSGASSPPTQNGQPSHGRLGRVWRWATMLTHSPVSASNRNSPSGRSGTPFVTPPYLQVATSLAGACAGLG